MNKVKMVAVMPVGPDNNGADTIEGLLRYCSKSIIVLAVDDSRNDDTRKFLENVDPRVIRLDSAGFKGIRGALFCSLARAYSYAVENYNFEILFRIDTDALVIGKAPEDDAITYIRQNPKAGMLGSYKIDYYGNERDFKIVAYAIRKESGLRGLTNPKRRKALRGWINDASKHGYKLGDHVLGAADFQSYACVRRMYDKGYLNPQIIDLFKESVISEDHFFSMLTQATGYDLVDFATGDLPFGVRWRGLPDSPQNLVERKKKVVHSIKFYGEMTESEIRTYFKKIRNSGGLE